MNIFSILYSSKGSLRSLNEDNFCFDNRTNDVHDDIRLELFCIEGGNFAVFDGMGGLSDGYIASSISAQIFSEGFLSFKEISNFHLSNLYIKANDSLCKYMFERNSTRVGTTVVTLSINNNGIIYSNIGDSKLYRIRNQEITQLTTDHTEIQFLLSEGFITADQAKSHPSKNKLTQHLGIFPNEFQIDPYIAEDSTEEGDIFILATDGVTNYFDNGKFLSIFEFTDLKGARDKIIDIVLKGGASDNFTFIIVKVGGEDEFNV
jgi:PPM family protein phosphatase